VADRGARLGVFSSVGSSLDTAIERARLAEQLGLESVWVNQLPGSRDAAVVLAAYAQATSRIGLGTGVLPIYTRHPTKMAQMAATLDELSGNRFILGIGVSHRITVESMWGLKLENPVEAMREYVAILRSSFVEGSANLDGKYFTAHFAYQGKYRADLPIMISALNPRMLELAGEVSDGVVLWMCCPAYIRDHVVPRVTAGRRKIGKDLTGFEIVAPVPVSLTSNPEAGRAAFKETVERYAALPFYRRMMDRSGFKEQLEAGQISDDMLNQLGGVGSVEELRTTIDQYRQAGCTLVLLGPFAGHEGAAGFEATLEALAA
jgi:F420-dependent oxidoreductase-like protein